MAAPVVPGAAIVVSGDSGMKITVNGQAREVPDDLTVDRLLAHLGVKREFTAVALNREVTRRADYGSTIVRDGDHVEIVRPMGGG
jgi:sulfur carrier protein